ncbi:MAG: ABC transporter permease [Candidatus Omnitrophota bacterium]|nr:ABC transporter permease [Candidatus Omnitrophota bacterium]
MISIIKELFYRRDLIRELVVKDLKIRYRRPALGFFWAFLSPFFTAVIFYVIFSLVLKAQIFEAPFILYLMTAVFPWRFFQDSLMASTTSLVDNRNLIKESAFPHYLIPLSIVVANFVIFLPSLLIVLIVAAFALKGAPLCLLFLPLVLASHFFITIGLSLLAALVYVKWRDIKYILELILMLLFYLTPVFYSVNLIKQVFPAALFRIYLYNPLVGVLQGYRICLLKGFTSSADYGMVFLAMPIVFAFLALAAGIYYYRRSQKNINDYLFY